MADFLSLLGLVPSLIANFSGSTSNPYGKQQDATAARMAQISAAQTDTSNPLYKQLYGQFQDQNRQSMAQTISEAQAQNRMNTGMGRTALFSPERGGETIFRNLMQGYQGMGQQADQQTRQALMQAQAGTQATGKYYNEITPSAVAGDQSQQQGYQTIFDTLRGVGQPSGYQSPYAGMTAQNNISGNNNNNSNSNDLLSNWLKNNQRPIISGGSY